MDSQERDEMRNRHAFAARTLTLLQRHPQSKVTVASKDASLKNAPVPHLHWLQAPGASTAPILLVPFLKHHPVVQLTCFPPSSLVATSPLKTMPTPESIAQSKDRYLIHAVAVAVSISSDQAIQLLYWQPDLIHRLNTGQLPEKHVEIVSTRATAR